MRVSVGTKVAMRRPDVRRKHLAALKRVFAATTNGNNWPRNRPQTQLEYAALLCPLGYIMDFPVSTGRGRGHHYVLDFALLESKTDVEIDGSSHRGRSNHDRERDVSLRALGWRVIRVRT